MAAEVNGARRVIRFAHTSAGLPASADRLPFPERIERDWAWGRATGRGVTACVVDSGVDESHPAVGGRVRSYRVERADGADEESWTIVPDEAGDVAGHGTACASIIRTLAPDCELVSVRILGEQLLGSGDALIAGLEWAVRQRFSLINLSLSTRAARYKERLRDIAEDAHFAQLTIVSAAHNSPVSSYPWKFSSVISVGSHGYANNEYVEVNPTPPVDFFANGVDVDVAWPGGGRRRISGNSFATPAITGLCARILECHPGFGGPQLRTVLTGLANNVQ